MVINQMYLLISSILILSQNLLYTTVVIIHTQFEFKSWQIVGSNSYTHNLNLNHDKWWVPINSIVKISNSWIKNLEFNTSLHKKKKKKKDKLRMCLVVWNRVCNKHYS